jgi:hypothetical protein
MISYQIQEVPGTGTRTGKAMFEIRYSSGSVAMTCMTRKAAESRVAKLLDPAL